MRRGVLLAVICLMWFLPSYGQEIPEPTDTTQTQKVIVYTIDGQERVGIILSDDGREILLLTESIGKVYITKENVVSIKRLVKDELEEFAGDYRTSGPFTTRYFLTTNALPIKKTEDYAMIHLYGPEVHYSLSDRFSLGIMTSWIASPFVLAAKYSIPTKNEKVNFGLGTLAGSSGYLNLFRGYGALHWGMVTFGDRMQNITLSAGFSYVQPGFQNDEYMVGTYDWDTTVFPEMPPEIPQETISSTLITSPVFSIAGVTKVGKRASFFFDSMIFFYKNNKKLDRTVTVQENQFGMNIHTIVSEPSASSSKGTLILAMPGMRFQKKENRAFQIALAGYTNISDGEFTAFPVPMCSWLLKF